VPQELRNTHPLGKRRFDKRIDLRAERDAVRAKVKRGPRWPLLILGVALALVVGAIILVVLWPKPAPLKAQVRTADGGADVLDITCESCPDGTVLRVRGAEATVTNKRATVPLDAPLDVGDRTLSVFIDRPGSGRDETVALPVRVAYRIRPDLTTLDADRPSLQIIIEAMDGATVQVDGADVNLRDHRAVKTVEVARDLTGPSMDGGAQLNRKVSFVVKPPNGPEEKGVVAVSVGIVQLSIDAPGRSIVTDRPTFVLSGHTTPGAEIVVAGRSLGVSKDGNFSQTMNVSSVGATEIEVRAKLAGRAPRLIRLAVERTTSLEAAATAFVKRGAMDYTTAAKSLDEAKGKSIAVVGEVLESKVQDGVTTMIVRVDGPGCERVRCIARLVQGRGDLGIDRGARIRAFGTVAGSIARDGETLPDVDVAFTIVDGPAVAPGAPSSPQNPPRL